MDKQVFVQNVRMYCRLRGIKPTIACAESGAGKSLLSQIETRGSMPSVEKVQLLAQYLGVSTSDLLGEKPTGPGDKKEPAPVSEDGLDAELVDIVRLFKNASPALRAAALAVLKSAEGQGKAPGEVSEAE